MKKPVIASSKVGSGHYRISYDADGEILAVEIWDNEGGAITTHEVLRITH